MTRGRFVREDPPEWRRHTSGETHRVEVLGPAGQPVRVLYAGPDPVTADAIAEHADGQGLSILRSGAGWHSLPDRPRPRRRRRAVGGIPR